MRRLFVLNQTQSNTKLFPVPRYSLLMISHRTPADTLANVCRGLCAEAPYRFFFSGPQLRGDGADLLLGGLVGPRVFTMSVEEGVDQGWLARPTSKMLQVGFRSGFQSEDANKMTQAHLYYNSVGNEKAAAIANAACQHGEGPVLILIDEIEQYAHLKNHLRFGHAFAHGPLGKENKRFFPDDFTRTQTTDPWSKTLMRIKSQFSWEHRPDLDGNRR